MDLGIGGGNGSGPPGNLLGSDSMVNAHLEIHDPPSPGSSTLGGLKHTIRFQFNPDLSISKSSSWTPGANPHAKAAPKPQFGGANAASMNLKFTLDNQEPPNPDVMDEVAWLHKCLACAPSLHHNGAQPLPPFVVFKFGSWGYGPDKDVFTGYVKSLQVTYTRHAGDGTPTQADITIGLAELDLPPAGQNPTSGTLERQRSRIVKAGDTLASISYEEYGKPTEWRVLAEANGIDDPARLRPGRHLLIPMEGGSGRRDHANGNAESTSRN